MTRLSMKMGHICLIGGSLINPCTNCHRQRQVGSWLTLDLKFLINATSFLPKKEIATLDKKTIKFIKTYVF